MNNTWTSGGLVNGLLGTIRGMLYNESITPPQQPYAILVEFDDFNGPYKQSNLFPIRPIIRSWEKLGRIITRKQFPLKLSYASTIHRAQGLTLSIAAVDIGLKEFASGLSYVVISRVKKPTDIMFIKLYDKKRFDSIGKSSATKSKIAFIEQYMDFWRAC